MTVGAIRRIVTAVAVLAAATVLVGSAQQAAQAANLPVGSFPVWTQPSASTFSGQLSPAAGGGTIAVTTTASNARVADTGQAAFLGAQTGFGQKFGSSRYQSYLTIGLAPRVPPASHGADSLTTVTLPTLPVGWGFAVGDIDADQVSIDASGPGGALSAADLNPQDTGGTPILNYCSNAAPKPSGCGAGTTFTDHPWWCATPGLHRVRRPPCRAPWSANASTARGLTTGPCPPSASQHWLSLVSGSAVSRPSNGGSSCPPRPLA